MTDQFDTRRDSVAVAILAAGHGKRMNSAMPKHIQPVAGVPIVERIIRAAQEIDPVEIAVVLSPRLMDLPDRLNMNGEFTPLEVSPPTGTGSAVLAAIEALPQVEYIVSLLGDNPLLTGETIRKMVDQAVARDTKVTILTCLVPEARGYGRIARNDNGDPIEIIEKENDDPNMRIGETEINSGIMVLKRDWALEALRNLPIDPVRKEYLLTDLVKVAVSEAIPGAPWPVDTFVGPLNVSVGVNDRFELEAADAIVRQRVRDTHMSNGITMVGPDTIFIDESVEIGQDTTLLPGTILMGKTKIGRDCVIGPYAVIIDSEIADGVTIRTSTLENAKVHNGADAGPYSHIRKGSEVGENVHIGNFVELKNTTMEADSKSGHFSYLGDAHIGERTNIGAGTITANYDGKTKNHTEIGNDVFIGSDSILVAPLTIESDSITGAGSVVTKNVKSGDTVVGVPARPIKSKPITNEE